MKKLFFMTAVVGLALTSCSQEDLGMPNQGDQNEITFAAPVVGKLTRANEVGNNYPITADYNFAVWAHYYEEVFTTPAQGSLYMDEVIMGFDGTSTWAPVSAKYYWPKNGTLTFAGYSPASVNAKASYTDGKITFTNYVVAADKSNQVDLMFSERSYNQKKYTANASDKTTDDVAGANGTGATPDVTDDVYTGAHLVFKHALSSVLFNVKTAADYTTTDKTKITLTGLTLNNVVSKGTFTQNIADAAGSVTVPPVRGNNTGDAWAVSTVDADKVNYTIDNASHLLTTTAFWPAVNAENDDAPANFVNGLRKTDLMLIPQSLANVTLTVNYTIQSETGAAIPQTSTINLSSLTGDDWDWGYRYIYTITIGLEKITIEPYVTPWTDVTGDTTI